MTWAKLSDDFIDDPVMLGLTRGVRLLYVEGTVWSCKHETDGVIPAHVLKRITDEPDVDAAVAQLVEAGLWLVDGASYVVADFADTQRSKADLEKMRRGNRFIVARGRMHRRGDHTWCMVPHGDLSSGDTGRYSRGESEPPDLTRPDPTVREGEGRAANTTYAPEGASVARQGVSKGAPPAQRPRITIRTEGNR